MRQFALKNTIQTARRPIGITSMTAIEDFGPFQPFDKFKICVIELCFDNDFSVHPALPKAGKDSMQNESYPRGRE
jgi:hypothetical protein